MRILSASFACSLGGLLLSGSLAARVTDSSGSASLTYFSETHSNAPGGRAGSSKYAVRGSLGDRATPQKR